MKRAVVVLALCSTVLWAGCAPSRVSLEDTRRDDKTDFSAIKTYAWKPISSGIEVEEPVLRIISEAIETQLNGKGMTRTEGQPDFLIFAHVESMDKKTVSKSKPVNYLVRARDEPMVESEVEYRVHRYSEGLLVLDFLEPKSERLIWGRSARMIANPKWTADELNKRINQLVQKLLQDFPPS